MLSKQLKVKADNKATCLGMSVPVAGDAVLGAQWALQVTRVAAALAIQQALHGLIIFLHSCGQFITFRLLTAFLQKARIGSCCPAQQGKCMSVYICVYIHHHKVFVEMHEHQHCLHDQCACQRA